MSTSYIYETRVDWTGERRGALFSAGLPSIQVASPPEFKGHEGVWTPEHLFVSAVSACFMTTFLAIAELSKLEFDEFSASAIGTLKKVDGKGYLITEIVIRPSLLIRHACDEDRALRILEKAENNCLISNSINSVVRLEPVVLATEAQTENVGELVGV